MGVDVFGRRRDTAESSRGAPGVGYKLTQDGQFDIENKRICNLASPTELNDAVNLNTLHRARKEEKEASIKFQAEIADSFLTFRTEIEELLINYNTRLYKCEEAIKQVNQGLEAIYMGRLKDE